MYNSVLAGCDVNTFYITIYNISKKSAGGSSLLARAWILYNQAALENSHIFQ